MTEANLKSEALFLEEIRKGNIIVTKDGRVFNNNTGHEFVCSEDRYKQITFRINGEKHYILLHRLVFIANNGLIDDATLQINHRDGVKHNSHPSNLELSTSSSNVQHAYDIGLSKVGQSHGRSKFNDEDVKNIRIEFSKGFETLEESAIRHSVSISTMYYLLLGKTWKHLNDGTEKECEQILLKNRLTLNNRSRSL